jgi:hypothetical protein
MESQKRTRELRRRGLTVTNLRQSLIFQPLAVLMATLLLPALSWMEGGGAGTRPFQARADIQLQGCASTNNSIIQNYCANGVLYYSDLVQLEADAVNAYLGAHNLPAGDAHVIYDYGRSDLRNAIRANIIAILLGIISTPAASRTTHQQALYKWLEGQVSTNEIAFYSQTYNHFLSWHNDPCRFTVDPQLASTYGISYDGAPYCGVSQSSIFRAGMPAPSYFKAYGLKKSYQAWAEKTECPVNAAGVTEKSCNTGIQETAINVGEIAGIAGTLGGAVAFTAGAALGVSYYAAAAAFTAGVSAATGSATLAAGDASGSAAFVISGAAADSLAIAASGVILPVAIILMDVAIGVTAGVQAFQYQQALDQLNDVNNQLTAAKTTLPDLNAMATDTSGLGLFKIENTVMNQTFHVNANGKLSDLPSTAPLPAHQLGSDLEFENEGNRTSYSALSHKGWNGEIWSSQTWGGWFVQTCTNGPKVDDQTDGTCAQTDSINADLHYIDWRFMQGLANVVGAKPFELSRFSLARNGSKFFAVRAAGNHQLTSLTSCPVSSWLGDVSQVTDRCWSYVDRQIPVVMGDGGNGVALLTNAISATFTSSPTLAFGPGIRETQTITIVGNPTPAVCITSSDLPANFTINGSPSYAFMGTNDCSHFSGFTGLGTVKVQLAFDGAQNAPNGVYSLTLKAVNNLGGANIHAFSQTFTVKVSPELAIISPNSMNVTSGVPANFTVVATGVPTPKLSIEGVRLGGMTFTDNGNGTATISGTDSDVATFLDCKFGKADNLVPCAIVASSSQGTVRQPFTVNVSPAPTASLLCSPCSATFYSGAPNQVVLFSTGASTPVTWSLSPFLPTPPSWLNLTDNGDGTATLSGTPPAGTTGTFSAQINPTAQYSPTIISLANYTINVADTPVFLNPNVSNVNAATTTGATAAAAATARASMATFTAADAAAGTSFSISANTGTISLATLLPAGLSFATYGRTAAISGTPAAGTGGQYILRFKDDAATLGVATQHIILNVNEAPNITSTSTATMFAGMQGSFAVTTTGFPSVSMHVIPPNPLPPTDPAQGNGMYFTVTGLPASLRATNLNPEGFATGTLTIEGTPTAADIGPHQVQITARNGVGMAAQQTLTLQIVQITGPAPASGTTCNGNYNGTFNGTITVSAGQNCSFYSGGVSGNVAVNGGNLALTNATVTGNMSIQGPSAFSLGPGTTINGNLAIDKVASGSSMSRICQTNVGGNLQISTSAIPILIGSPQASCYSNSFGGNVDIEGNTAAISFYENHVAKNLSCSGNSSITGGGNTAQKKEGQCATF